MKKYDWVLIGISVCVISVGFLICSTLKSKDADVAIVMVDGKTKGIYSLNRENEIEIDKCNRIKIKNNQVTMIYANCPDQICTNHKPISKHNESIICLPNKVSIMIKSNQEMKIDVVSK